MKTLCPKCRAAIPSEDINVGANVALCRICGESYDLSRLVKEKPANAVDLTRPPDGSWFRSDSRGFQVRCTTRSAAAFFLIPFMCVWSTMSVGMIYYPQIAQGQFSLFMSLFGIPFLFGTVLGVGQAAMTVCGHVSVRVEGNKGVVFTGVGPFGKRRPFAWNAVSDIRRTVFTNSNGRESGRIAIEGFPRIEFAGGLTDDRFNFMLDALRQMREQYR